MAENNEVVRQVLVQFFGNPLDPRKQETVCSDQMKARYLHSWVRVASTLFAHFWLFSHFHPAPGNDDFKNRDA